MKNLIGCWLVLLVLNLVGVEMACTYSKDTVHPGILADCSHGNLSSIPSNLPGATTSLLLNNNNFQHLVKRGLSHLLHLRNLNLNFNPIMDIHEEAFNNLSRLENLQIVGHQLNYSHRALPNRVFLPLVSLRDLKFRSRINKPSCVLPYRAFGHLKTLESLDMDTCETSDFNVGFSQMRKLKKINLASYVVNGTSFMCKLANLHNGTFSVFQTMHISTLNLSGCPLAAIESNTFSPFLSLENLFMEPHSSKIYFPDVIGALHVFRNRTLNSVTIRYFWDSLFILKHSGFPLTLEILSNICIHNLDLSYNQINMVDWSALFVSPTPRLTKCLKRLDMSYNHINGIITHPLWMFLNFQLASNLEFIDLSHQSTFQLNGKMTYYNMYSINAANTFTLAFPPNIKYLYLNGLLDRIGFVPNLKIVGGENMLSLNVSYVRAVFTKFSISGLENLQILDLSMTNCRAIGPLFFDSFPNLTTLRMSKVNLDTDYFFDNGKRLFQPLKKLQVLDLTNNLLNVLPKDIFEHLTYLREIMLSFNHLVNLPDWTYLPNLEALYLGYNALVEVDKHTRDALDNLAQNGKIHVHLYGNTFSCACAATPMLEWFAQTTVILDGGNYSCITQKGEKTSIMSLYSKFNSFRLKCASDLWLTLSVTSLSFLIVAILTLFVVIKNRLKIQLLLRRLLGLSIHSPKREDFRYDACIMYADDVYGWVCHAMYPQLQVRRGLKLYFRDRCEIPGIDRADEIRDVMRSSWRVVLILSSDFLSSDLAFYTVKLGLSLITAMTPYKVILVMDCIPHDIDSFLEVIPEENVFRYDISNGIEHGIEHDTYFWNSLYDCVIGKCDN